MEHNGSSDIINAALVGCGGISATHLTALRSLESEGVRIASLFDTKRERTERRCNEFGGETANSFEQILGDPRITTVHILTPHALHAGLAKTALAAGKYVLCEKPLATSYADLDELVRLDPDNRRLCCIFQNRYNPSSQRAKALIDSGEMGRVVTLKGQVTWHRDARYYQDDWHGTLALECGGVLINQAIHTLDLMLYLGGALAAVKGGVTTDLLQDVIEVEENAHAVFRYADGKIGLFHASNSFGYDDTPEVQAVCERGILVLRGDQLFLRIPPRPDQLLVDREDYDVLGKAVYGNSHITQIREFYRCVRSGEPFAIGAKEAAPAARAVLAVYESSRLGQWVNVG
ncbi:oxidoreductase [Clostridia bacterium]|nr:oxidoreductase [Clostridia bacterium]